MNRRLFLSFLSVSPVIAKSIISNNDIYFQEDELKTFLSIRKKIGALKMYVGYGNFNIISFDDALKYTRYSNKLESFSKNELDFLEKIFYTDAKKFNFYGDRTCFKLTDKINKKDVIKIPKTGHYLFKGKPLGDYKRLINDIGSSLYLTSGVRGVLKQFDLYFAKIHKLNFNISKASKIIAPPGYSYHSVSDFDVGKKGLGYYNFTIKFAKTDEFKKIKNLNYISLRYTKNNKDGVRYEPWHIQVI